jgi:hypothetical protein
MADYRPADDLTISDNEQLYLRIFPASDALTVVEGGYRPNSGSLKRGDEPVSVDLGSISTPENTRDRDTSSPFHVAQFTAGIARSAGCRVVRDPEPDNPAHALVYGNRQNRAKSFTGGLTKGEGEKIARLARLALVNHNAKPPNNE